MRRVENAQKGIIKSLQPFNRYRRGLQAHALPQVLHAFSADCGVKAGHAAAKTWRPGGAMPDADIGYRLRRA